MSDDQKATVDRIADDLRTLGVQPGGVLLVHSSLKSMGHVPGGAETVVQGLLAALGPSGTLLMPALSYATVGPARPNFDVRQTPSCVGAITEHFRTRGATERSIHPTHSVCGVGPLAHELLSDHHHDSSPCGPRSPFRKLRDYSGQLLMLGCGLRPNTSFHAIEETISPPYLFHGSFVCTVIMPDGSKTKLRSKLHGFTGYRQRYDRIERLLEDPHLLTGKVLEADCHLFDVEAMWEQATKAYRFNKLIFVESTVPRPEETADVESDGDGGETAGGEGGADTESQASPDPIDDYLAWSDPGELHVLCTNCGKANSRFEHYCQHCNMPIGQYVAYDPYHSLFVQGHGFRKAARPGRSGMLLLGIVLMLTVPAFYMVFQWVFLLWEWWTQEIHFGSDFSLGGLLTAILISLGLSGVYLYVTYLAFVRFFRSHSAEQATSASAESQA